MEKDLAKEKLLAAKEAVKLVKTNQIVGLGSGSTAEIAINELALRMKNEGLTIKGVPSSNRTAELATSLGIPLIDINTIARIDITIDGADEFTPELFVLKGGGGALLKEKIVASMSREEIIIADSTKKVKTLGRFTLPMEVIPFAYNYILHELQLLNGFGKLRMKNNEDQPYITDEGNNIIDADFGLITDPAALASKLKAIVGVVEHGIYINLATKVIMGEGDSVVTFGKQA
ncbi:ribose-5-phosphate isomerase RpiA [Danxiaibacter flavus]|uniref:Ribose-5-phosphate isomerase A n=2 Tax=Danxiaibacter flavus TaxID=3049108 RepID=A0ABV3ZD95_9BACT